MFPIKKIAAITNNPESWRNNLGDLVEIPIGNHPGAFNFKRKNHYHEGVDLYAQNNEPIYNIKDAIIINIHPFTGKNANSPWWEDTFCVLTKSSTCYFLYGEIIPNPLLKIGDFIKEGALIGKIKTVLKKDKGLPMSMLHLECYDINFNISSGFPGNSLNSLPQWVLDPTPFLLKEAGLNNINV